MPAGQQSGAVGLHAGRDRHHTWRGYRGLRAQGQEGERNLREPHDVNSGLKFSDLRLQRGAVKLVETVKVSPNAFGNGDKKIKKYEDTVGYA